MKVLEARAELRITNECNALLRKSVEALTAERDHARDEERCWREAWGQAARERDEARAECDDWRAAGQALVDAFDPLKPTASPASVRATVAGAKAAHGVEPPGMPLLIATEKEPPFDVIVYRMGESSMIAAEAEVADLLARLAECQREGRWPGRHEDEQTLELPMWALPSEDDLDLEDPDWLKGAGVTMKLDDESDASLFKGARKGD